MNKNKFIAVGRALSTLLVFIVAAFLCICSHVVLVFIFDDIRHVNFWIILPYAICALLIILIFFVVFRWKWLQSKFFDIAYICFLVVYLAFDIWFIVSWLSIFDSIQYQNVIFLLVTLIEPAAIMILHRIIKKRENAE
jgi:hypothetical protein